MEWKTNQKYIKAWMDEDEALVNKSAITSIMVDELRNPITPFLDISFNDTLTSHRYCQSSSADNRSYLIKVEIAQLIVF